MKTLRNIWINRGFLLYVLEQGIRSWLPKRKRKKLTQKSPIDDLSVNSSYPMLYTSEVEKENERLPLQPGKI